MTAKQNLALSYMRRARDDDPNTSDGLLVSESSFYDSEVAVAMIHWRTARALVAAGVARYGDSDPEWGTELLLAPRGAR